MSTPGTAAWTGGFPKIGGRRTARPPQQASSISSARGTLGKYRHLLMIVQPTTGIDDDGTQQNFGTFFGEIDVYAAP